MIREGMKKVGVVASIFVLATGTAFTPVKTFTVNAESAVKSGTIKTDKETYTFTPDETSYEAPVFIDLTVLGLDGTDYLVDFEGTEIMGNMLWAAGVPQYGRFDKNGDSIISVSLHGYKCVNDGEVKYGKHTLHVNIVDKESELVVAQIDIPVTLEKKAEEKKTEDKTEEKKTEEKKADDVKEQQAKVEVKAVKPSIELSKSEFSYNGKVQRPKITVKVDGKKIDESEYDITYTSGCKNVGKHKVTVTLKGKYTGKATATYIINPKAVSLSKTVKDTKGFKAKWKKQTKEVTGYQIQYSTDKKFKKNLKTVVISKNKTTSKLIKAKSGKKYYVRIRTYKKVNGKKYYSSWSKTKTIKVK